MIYSMIVKKRIRQSFDQVNNHDWDALMTSIAPNVHHRFLGAHAIGGERHDRDTLRRWFERLGRVLPNLSSRSTTSGSRARHGTPPCSCNGTAAQPC